MLSTTAKRKNKPLYKPLLEDIEKWPVYRLNQHRKEFLEAVCRESLMRIKELRPSHEKLVDEIETTVYREQNRMKRNQWRVDPSDDKDFWNSVKRRLTPLHQGDTEDVSSTHAMLHEIVMRYTEEIAGNFKPGSYRFAKHAAKFWFSRLLNGSQVKKFGAIFRSEYTLQDKIGAVGEIDMLRSLATRGTIVMVPTHFSNLDSLAISFIIHFLGLPPFIYGAGLNLFNIKIFAYFMNGLGAYKVDRRKKNLIYIETLKAYSSLALQRGAHSLFFPGGTRSRSGSIETHLQLGLLSTPVEAQRNLLMDHRKHGRKSKCPKIFIVPVTFNYHFVLEAPDIIDDYLHKKGQDRYLPENNKYGSFQMLKFLFKFFTKGSSISASIGPALDVLGNYVDKEGNSLDAQGRIIDVEEYFISEGKLVEDRQRAKEYTRLLSRRIIDEYHRIGYVYASHLAAFVAFEMWQKQYPKLDLFDLLRMPEEDMSIAYDNFCNAFDSVRQQIFRLVAQKEVGDASDLVGAVEESVQHGIDNVGVFHANRPLLQNRKGEVVTQDLNLLYYYHNRLAGYGLERFI